MNVGETFVRMALDSRDYEKGMARMEGYTRKKAMTLGNIFKGAFSVAMGIGLLSSFKTLGNAVTEFISTAAKTEMFDVALQSVARSAGYATAALDGQKKAVMDLGIAEQEATQILMRSMQSQLDMADVLKIVRVAQDAAVLSAENSSVAATNIINAITKLRPELLNNYGMTRNLNSIYKDYAATVGKAASNLSEYDKRQAMINYILKEGTKIAGTYEAAMGTVGKQLGSLEKLELSKKLLQELKTALAKPLLLPAFGVWVEGVTNGLRNIKAWVDENQKTLYQWGQTAVSIAAAVIKAFKFVGRMFVENWAAIKYMGIALATYAVVTRTAAISTTVFMFAAKMLSGQLAINTGLLGFINNVIVFYKVAMLGAAGTTNVFTGALVRLRAALYAVHTALGPIGWAIIGISLAITGGAALWNKYTQSLQKAAKAASPADMAKKFRSLETSTKGAADAAEDQADALSEAGKAAGKSLQSFDEVHQLQEDMAGSGADMMDGLDVGDIFEDVGAAPAFDLSGIMDGLEEIKPTLKGFWEWIKQQAGSIPTWLKENFGHALNWLKETAANVWERAKEKWGELHPVAKGIIAVLTTILIPALVKTGVEAAISAAKMIASWAASGAAAIASVAQQVAQMVVAGAKWVWLGIQAAITAAKVVAAWVIQGAQAVASVAVQIAQFVIMGAKWVWMGVTAMANAAVMAAAWVIALGPVAWVTATVIALAALIIANWDWVKENTIEIWEATSTWLAEKWEWMIGLAGESWASITDSIAGAVQIAWNCLQDSWNKIAGFLDDTWQGIKTTAGQIWEGITSVIKGAINGIIGMINRFIKAFNKIEIKVPEIDIPFVGTVGGWSIRVPQIPEIPTLAKGGLVMDPTLAMIGEAGPEAVIPLGRSGFTGDLADAVAKGVYQAIMDAARISKASESGSDSRDVILKIDGTTLARMQLPAIIREGQRQGLNLIVQGV